jgi:hypothetical protein
MRTMIAKKPRKKSRNETMPQTEPVRLSILSAARRLDLHPETVRRLERRGLFTSIRPTGRRGPNQRVFLPADEVDILAIDGEAALLAYRIKKGRTKGTRS